MQFFKSTLSAIIIGFILSSCDPCKNLDCIASNYFKQFRVVSTAGNNDLVFGTSKVYDRNRIKFFSLRGSDTTFFSYEAVKSYRPGYDSVLSVIFLPKTDTAYMQLSKEDIDTLKITYKTYGTKCCGTITEIANVKFNNFAPVPSSSEPQELKK